MEQMPATLDAISQRPFFWPAIGLIYEAKKRPLLVPELEEYINKRGAAKLRFHWTDIIDPLVAEGLLCVLEYPSGLQAITFTKKGRKVWTATMPKWYKFYNPRSSRVRNR